jgi:hypothetical protein
VRLSLYFDDVGAETCIAVEGPHSVVIERIRIQTINTEGNHIANIQIVVGPHKSTKRAAGRNV